MDLLGAGLAAPNERHRSGWREVRLSALAAIEDFDKTGHTGIGTFQVVYAL